MWQQPRWRRWCAMVLAVVVAGPAVAQQSDDEPEIPIYIEDSPAAADLVKKAELLRSQDRLLEAAAAYQKVTETYPHKLMARKDGLNTDALLWVRQAIRSDGELLAAYRRANEAQAQRQLAAASQPQPDAAALAAVLRRFTLCQAGLEAGLRLSALLLERADAAGAADVLDELADHPDLNEHLARWHELSAAAALFGQRQDLYQSHRDALAPLPGGQAALGQLDTWSQRLHEPATDRAVTPLQTLADVSVPSLSEPPRWQMQIPADEPSGAMRMWVRGRGTIPSETFHAIIPVAEGDRLYLNSGQAVAALDRSSQFQLWAYALGGDSEEDPSVRRFARSARYEPDQRGVMVSADRVVAVLGQVPSWPLPWRLPMGNTFLVCLDKTTGQPLWRVEPGDLDKGLANAHFHGTPVAGHGRVYVLIRRSQMSNFQDAYVAAVELETGKLLWRRHLASSIAQRISNGRSLSAIVADRDRLYVADNLGVVASLSGRTGTMLWLRVLSDLPQVMPAGGISPIRSQAVWQLSPPLLCQAGLLLPPLVPSGPAMLLDRQTGRIVRDLPGEAWAEAIYLTPAGDDVLAVGQTVTLFDGKTLEIKWQRKLGNDAAALPQGLASVTPSHALVPTSDKLVELDMKTGAIETSYRMDYPGNVLALDGQVILASGAAVRSYMDWKQVYANLTRLIATYPDDPTHGLALADVALSAKEYDASLEGIDKALAALRHVVDRTDRDNADERAATEALQDKVFRQLLTFVEPQRARNPKMRRLVFDRLARAAAGPQHDVAYQLSLGAFLTEIGQPDDAADHYQTVLSDATLSAQLYERPDGSRQAGLEARLRLAALVKKHGPRVYVKYETEAAQKLVEQKQAPSPDVKALSEIARRYPLSRSAPEALAFAADALARDGQDVEAINQLRQAYRHMAELRLVYEQGTTKPVAQPALAQRVVGRLAQLYAKRDQPWRARHWLQRFKREYTGLDPLRDGRPVPVDQWLTELADRRAAPGRLPAFAGDIAQPWAMPGGLITPTRQAPATWPRDKFALIRNGAVEMHGGADLARLWELPVADGKAELLSLNDEQALFWLDKAGSITAVDAQSGRVLWRPIVADTALAQVGAALPLPPDRAAEQQRFLQLLDQQPGLVPLPLRRAQVRLNGKLIAPNNGLDDPDEPSPTVQRYFIEVNETIVCLADRRGRAVGIDRQSGQIMWRYACPVDRLTLTQINDETVVLAGVADTRTDAQRWSIIVLDPLTGEPACPRIEEPDPLIWVGLGGDGLVLHLTADQAVAHSAIDGSVAWRLPIRGPTLTAVAWAEQDLMMARDVAGRIIVIDPRIGKVVNRVSGLSTENDAPLDLRAVGQRWHLLSPRAAVALNLEGQEDWRDGIGEKPANLAVQLVGEQYVVMLSLSETDSRRIGRQDVLAWRGGNLPIELRVLQDNARPPQAAWYYRLYLLDRHSGILRQQRSIGPLGQVIDATHAAFLENRIVLSTGGATIIIPSSGQANP